jgi:hypothetical protein
MLARSARSGLRGVSVTDADALAVMYDALGYAVRELGRAHDTLTSIIGGVAVEQLAGAVLEATQRVERVYAVAAELRGRYA